MTMYHRGRKQSPYRKRSGAALLNLGVPSTVFSTVLLQAPAAGGTLLAKSFRAIVLAPARSNPSPDFATGWVGYGRSSAGDTSPNFGIEQSDVFGVVPWNVGVQDDVYIDLPLKGITLTAGERFYLVGAVLARGGSSAQPLRWSAIWAQMDVPA